MSDEQPLPESVTAAIAGCAAAHARLFVDLEKVDDIVLARPSRLPSWTVGHVLTHLARNADSFVRMLGAAEVGESVSQYPSVAQRNTDIEAGAHRSAAACVNDVRRSAERLEQAFADATPTAWRGAGVSLDGQPAPCAKLPLRRWKEVEIHHVDLGNGYEAHDWPEDFVSVALADAVENLPARVPDPSQRGAVLSWLIGRSPSPGQVDFTPY